MPGPAFNTDQIDELVEGFLCTENTAEGRTFLVLPGDEVTGEGREVVGADGALGVWLDKLWSWRPGGVTGGWCTDRFSCWYDGCWARGEAFCSVGGAWLMGECWVRVGEA